MRLVNIYSIALEEFEEPDIPPYCIASHRWLDDEITFEDFTGDSVPETGGYQKIKDFCEYIVNWQSSRTNVPKYLWIDTCCIDKRSSAELAKSINSMFKWYQNAEICLAYLPDVRRLSDGSSEMIEDFKQSVWFSRGWTLQELLAPADVLFLNHGWETIGIKSSRYSRRDTETDLTNGWCSDPTDISFHDQLSAITKIPTSVLWDYSTSAQIPIAEKWKWLEGRTTKIPEDMAYCMLGIFGVFMALIYGEGDNARMRLEEEIEAQQRRQAKRKMENVWRRARLASRPELRRDQWPPMAVLSQSSASDTDLNDKRITLQTKESYSDDDIDASPRPDIGPSHHCKEPGCKREFRFRQELRRHQVVHRPREPCPYQPCRYEFQRKDQLRRHTRQKHPEELERVYCSERPFRSVGEPMTEPLRAEANIDMPIEPLLDSDLAIQATGAEHWMRDI